MPSDDLRNGIVHYIDATRAVRTLTPSDLRTIVDPAGIGPSQAVLDVFNKVYPRANDYSLGDTYNLVGNRFTPPVRSDQNTYIAKFDHHFDSAGKHTMFIRGNLQNDSANSAPQFPGQPPNNVNLNNSKDIAVGYTAVVRNNVISTFRYGFTRQGTESTGVETTPVTTFPSPYGTTLGLARIVPLHTITQDLAWTKGAHDVRFPPSG